MWKRLALGSASTRYSQRAPAESTAQLPHPFFDNRFRAVEGTAQATRNEPGTHMQGRIDNADRRTRVRMLVTRRAFGNQRASRSW